MKLRSRAVNLIVSVTPASSGAVAVFSLTKPVGTVSKTLITDPDGHATAQFALSPSRDKAGTYQGRVRVAVGSEVLTDQVSLTVR